MNVILKADLYRYCKEAGLKGLIKGLMIPGFRYVFLMRKSAKKSRFSIIGFFYWLLLRRYMFKYGFQIPASTQIGKGLYIGHFGAIVINEMTIIGDNCSITYNVTIGKTNRGSKKGCPVIGNEVWIGAGAVIVGKITIGSNVLIAPNAFVNFDIPSDSIVIGNPARIIPDKNATQGYNNSILEQE
jgi:serine O-acetyltransferase